LTNTTFKNHYFMLRHGESTPIVRDVIVSHWEEGKKDQHALTPYGEEQVFLSVTETKKRGSLDAATIIYSSTFSRCKKTAEIARDVLGAEAPIVFDDRLRERWFGDWEGTSNESYKLVGAKDVLDPTNKDEHVESVMEVLERMLSLVREIDRQHDQKNILLVSHGDPLQILQTFFKNQPMTSYRTPPRLAVAEIREIND